MNAFAQRQRLTPGMTLPRHRHVGAYAALVLSGGYEEAGDAGRRRVEAGDVVLHGPFEAHLDRSGRVGARVLNLPTGGLTGGFRRLDDPDAVARLAERDPIAAARLLTDLVRPAPFGADDWPDRLAAALAGSETFRLEDWALRHGLTPEAVSRGFRRVFAVSPSRFRLEARARQAWGAVRTGGGSLAAIAADAGFADQAHMTRAVSSLTGRPPGAWRIAA